MLERNKITIALSLLTVIFVLVGANMESRKPAVKQKVYSVKEVCGGMTTYFKSVGVPYVSDNKPYRSLFETGSIPITGPGLHTFKDENRALFICGQKTDEENTSHIYLRAQLGVNHDKTNDAKNAIKALHLFDLIASPAREKIEAFFDSNMNGITAQSFFDPQAVIQVPPYTMHILTVQGDQENNFSLMVDLNIDFG